MSDFTDRLLSVVLGVSESTKQPGTFLVNCACPLDMVIVGQTEYANHYVVDGEERVALPKIVVEVTPQSASTLSTLLTTGSKVFLRLTGEMGVFKESKESGSYYIPAKSVAAMSDSNSPRFKVVRPAEAVFEE